MFRPNEDLTFAESGLSSLLPPLSSSLVSITFLLGLTIPLLPFAKSAFLLKPNALLISLNLQKKSLHREAVTVIKRTEMGNSRYFRRPFPSIYIPSSKVLCLPVKGRQGCFCWRSLPLPDILGSRERSGLLLLRRSQAFTFQPSIFQSASTPWPTQTSRYKGPPPQ